MNKIIFSKPHYGNIMLVEENNKLVECKLVNEKEDSKEINSFLDKAKTELIEYLDGKREKFDIPLFIQGTVLEQKVYKALLQVNYGNIVTYKELAEKAGLLNASRFVGNTMSKNKLLFYVPCHRVIRENGDLGGYAAGVTVKESLLDLEGLL